MKRYEEINNLINVNQDIDSKGGFKVDKARGFGYELTEILLDGNKATIHEQTIYGDIQSLIYDLLPKVDFENYSGMKELAKIMVSELFNFDEVIEDEGKIRFYIADIEEDGMAKEYIDYDKKSKTGSQGNLHDPVPLRNDTLGFLKRAGEIFGRKFRGARTS